jgi:hypothetical protein
MVSDDVARLLWTRQNQSVVDEIPSIAKDLIAGAA